MFGLNNFLTASKFFLVIAGELVLIFVAVSFIIGVLMEYLPPSRVRDFLSNKLGWVQYLLGSGLGAITPFCSCSTVPIAVLGDFQGFSDLVFQFHRGLTSLGLCA